MTMLMAIIFLALQLTIPYWKKKVVEDAVMSNYEDINDEIIIDDYDNLDSYIDPQKHSGN